MAYVLFFHSSPNTFWTLHDGHALFEEMCLCILLCVYKLNLSVGLLDSELWKRVQCAVIFTSFSFSQSGFVGIHIVSMCS